MDSDSFVTSYSTVIASPADNDFSKTTSVPPSKMEVEEDAQNITTFNSFPFGEVHIFDASVYPTKGYKEATSLSNDFHIDLKLPENCKKTTDNAYLVDNNKNMGIIVASYAPPGMRARHKYGLIELQRHDKDDDQISVTWVHAGKQDYEATSVPIAAAYTSGTTTGSNNKDFWAKYAGKVNDEKKGTAKFLTIEIHPSGDRSRYNYRCRLHVLDEEQCLLISSNYSSEWSYASIRRDTKRIRVDSEERGWKVLPQDPQYRRIPETLLPSGRTTSSPTRICDTDPGVDGLGGLRLHDTRSHSPLSHQSVTGRTALHEASSNGCLNIVELLLPHMSKAECDVQDNDGCTALHLASSNGHPEIVHLLLEKGADHTIPDKEGYLALSSASSKGHAEVVDLLLCHLKGRNIPTGEKEEVAGEGLIVLSQVNV